jgi:hypothetical protein
MRMMEFKVTARLLDIGSGNTVLVETECAK